MKYYQLTLALVTRCAERFMDMNAYARSALLTVGLLLSIVLIFCVIGWLVHHTPWVIALVLGGAVFCWFWAIVHSFFGS